MNAIAIGFGALLLVVSTGAIWFRAAHNVRLPKNRSGFIAVWLCAGILGIMSVAQGPGWVGGIPAALSILGTVFLLFTVAVSRQQVEAHAITVGATLPDFTATDENGVLFHASSLAGHPVLIKFFRGHW